MGDGAAVDPLVELAARMRRTDARRGVLAVLFGCCVALIVVLYVVRPGTGPDGPPTRITILSIVLVLSFGGGAVYQGYLVATGGRRREHLVSVLNSSPNQIDRIYAAVAVRVGRSAVVRPVKCPEVEHLGRRVGYQIVVRLKEPSRTRRLMNLSTYIIAVPRVDVLPLLAFLRSRAPGALGPP